MLDDLHKRKMDMADELFVIIVAAISGPVPDLKLSMHRQSGKWSGFWSQWRIRVGYCTWTGMNEANRIYHDSE